jgi:translocation and assembly module TamB
MRVLFFALLCLSVCLPATATAQEDGDDRTRIVRFLESQLSDGARQVSIRGFRGALSSTAELDRLTIADAEGIWLSLENATLTWSRAALLRGELQIDTLTAAALTVARPPVTEPGIDLPEAEVTPFSLPDLPVSVNIDEVAIDRIELGPSFIGTPVALSAEGSARLAGGAGQADLEILRLDGPRGVFDLSAGYDNATRQVDVSLLLEEDAGGLAANALGLPGAPAVRLAIAGSDPIDDFSAEIALSSDGQPRLTGTVATALAPDTGVRDVTAQLSGDITPLVLPDYRDFFGPEVALTSRVRLLPDGAIALDALDLRAAALTLSGDAEIAPNGRPEAFSLTGRIAGTGSATTVRLPVRDTEVRVGSADLVLNYDRADGDSYTAEILVDTLRLGPAEIGRLRLDAGGMIADTPQGLAVSSPIRFDAEGIDHDDPALAQALGDAVRLSAQLSWIETAPLILSDLDAAAGDLGLTGAAALGVGSAQLTLDTDLAAEAADLSRFAAVAGQPLAGQLSADLAARAELLSGAFDIVLTGNGQDLRVADALPAQLFAGETTLTLSALRDETGVTLRDLTLEGREARLAGDGRVNSGGAVLGLEARLANVGLFTDALSGPVSGTLDATRGPGDAAPWRVASSLSSGAGITASMQGSVAADARSVDLDASGQLPLALANRALAPRSIFGTLGFDLTVDGPPALSSVAGSFSSGDARITLPVLQTALEGVSLRGSLAGGRVAFDAGGQLGTGGTLSAQGGVTISDGSLPASIDITGDGLRLVDPTLYEVAVERADLSVDGALAGAMEVSGDVALGTSELRVPESGVGGTAAIPPITHTGETAGQRGTRLAAGLGPARTTGGGGSRRVALDISIAAPGRIFIRGRGLDAELGGNLRIIGTAANVVPQGRLDLIRGRLSILGTRLDLTDGSATLQGSFDPFIRLTASTRAGEYQIGINIVGPISTPEISLSSSPSLPEDEILAQLLFGRSVSSLSPTQLLQMANAAASLAGGSSDAGLFARLREGLGLDDLDIQTDSEGNAAVRAGRYLSENVYSDVTIGSGGEADISLNIDLTPSVTARGTFSSDGDTSLGVFFERDY